MANSTFQLSKSFPVCDCGNETNNYLCGDIQEENSEFSINERHVLYVGDRIVMRVFDENRTFEYVADIEVLFLNFVMNSLAC